MTEAPVTAAHRDLLEHRSRGEHPSRTMGFLFRAQVGQLLLAAVYFLVETSPAVLLPIPTARIIDALGRPDLSAALQISRSAPNRPRTIHEDFFLKIGS